MPQVGIGDEKYASGPSVFDAPKLEPAFKDERARIFIPNPDELWVEYRHSLGGQRSGVTQQFGGNWLCTGRAEVLNPSNPHADPEACVLCRTHASGDPLVSKAVRKWVIQVFRYQTDPSGGQLAMPFNVRLLVWLFSDREYRAMTDIQAAWGDIRKYDLILTCTNKDFKNWDVMVQPQAMWASQPDWVALVQESYRQQHISGNEIELIIGRRASNEAEVMAKLQELRAPAAYGQPSYGPFDTPPQQPSYFPGMPPPPTNGAPPPFSMPPTNAGPGQVPAAGAIPPSPVPPQPVMTPPPAAAGTPFPEPPAGAFPTGTPGPTVQPGAVAPSIPLLPQQQTQPVAAPPVAPPPVMQPPPQAAPPVGPVPPVAPPAPAPATEPPQVDFASLLQVPPAPPPPA